MSVTKQDMAALLCGIVFGLGLALSAMIDPAKVLAFLDVTGNWDPSLAFVMGGAVVTYFIGFRLVMKKHHPVLASGFQVPKRTDLDRNLILGAVLFGIGWGIAGLCPGPAITGLAYGAQEAFIFFGAMLVGSFAYSMTLKTQKG